MADKGLYLIDVTIKPCAYAKDVLSGSWTNLVAGSKEGKGVIVHGFKVVVVDVDVDVVDLRAQADASMPASNNNVSYTVYSNF